ncbi:hypothetical protein [Rhizobium sp. SL42]|uniref:hypothetical protein n=1 Tax=Rhizobium sp. SL42 TaxID=2806346 RepID=UPI001F2C356B|nr:hypothetical protein [Rhizobium sp. SL42]UJW73220.1 hypothetical protein IM739_09705 [Rhizobium sp. SL42]
MLSARLAITSYFTFASILLIGVIARPTGPFVVVVTNPADNAVGNMAAVTGAGGRFVWSGRYSWISVAQSDAPDFASRLFKAGAILVLNHDLAVGCLEGQ